MGDTKIQWTDKVWNPVTGCVKVSQGCKNCYAETIAKRFWGERKFTDVQCHEDRLEQPLHWKKPAKIFVNSMSDLFHENVPFEFIDEVFHTIAFSPKHIFQILTKRPLRMLEYFSQSDYCVGIEHIKNVWLGVSIEDQKTADERIPLLLKTPAAVRFLSVEPMLGNINIKFIGCPKCGHSENNWFPNYTICRHCNEEVKSPPDNKIDWVVCGGESGPHARPLHSDWVRSLRDECKEAGVPFFFKQWGEWVPEPDLHKGKTLWFDGSIGTGIATKNGIGRNVRKVGKKTAGRLLDGVEHNEFPEGVINVTE